MDKLLKIALMLTAIDNMSSTVNAATNNAMSQMKKMQQAGKDLSNGFLMVAAGKAGMDALKPTVEAFGDMEEAGLRLQNAMMKDGGILDQKVYQKMYSYAQRLSDGYTGSTEDYLNMMRVLKNNRISEGDILGGIGEATAKLGHLFKMQPAEIGEFAAHMRNDMGVAVKDMNQVMDLTNRVHLLGVGKDGQEAVYHMNQFFSKVGLGLTNLKVGGIESAKAMGILGSIFMAKGISGESVGTNFRRILDGLRDPTKIAKANEVARQYGQTLSFYDKKGKFAGVENFIAQLDKLKGLSTTAVAEILKPFSGRQGLSTDFLELLAHSGVEDYNAYGKAAFSKATMTQQEANISRGLNQNRAIFASSWRNTMAEIGSTVGPMLTKMFMLLNKVAIALRNVVHNHPFLTKVVVALIALGSTALMIAGSIKIFKFAMHMADMLLGVTKALKWLRIAWALQAPAIWSAVTATWAWTTALLANPVTWIVLAVIALGVAVYAMIKHWDKVGPFFRRMWDSIKNFFKWGVDFVKKCFLMFNPIGLIIKYWQPLTHFFTNLWEKAKHIFWGAVVWLMGLGVRFYNAGKNIVTSIFKGIMALAHKPVEAMKHIVDKVRNLLPFSPAKEGPLRDIHKIRLVETIAESIKPNALLDKMRRVASAVFELRPQQAAFTPSFAGSGGGSITIHLTYAPVYHAGPNEDITTGRSTFMLEAGKNQRELVNLLMKEIERRQRKQY